MLNKLKILIHLLEKKLIIISYTKWLFITLILIYFLILFNIGNNKFKDLKSSISPENIEKIKYYFFLHKSLSQQNKIISRYDKIMPNLKYVDWVYLELQKKI